MEQELLTLPEHLCSPPVFSGVRVGRSLFFCVLFCGSSFVLFLLAIVLSTTNVASSNPVHGEVHSIQHYVIKFVSDLRQVGDFLLVLRFPPSIKLTATV